MSTATKSIEQTFEKQQAGNIVRNNKKINRMFSALSKQLARDIHTYELVHPTAFIGDPEAKLFYRKNKALQRIIEKNMKQFSALMQGHTNGSMKENWALSNSKNDALVHEYLKSMGMLNSIETAYLGLNLPAMKAFINRAEAGLNLSGRVWKTVSGASDQIEVYLGSGIAQGRSASRLATDMNALLREPARLYRRVRKDGKLVLSKAAAQYHPGAGVYRSAYQNALRMTATETNMAYRMSDFSRRQQLPFITGIVVHLSAAHPRFDICDSMTGDYPKGFVFTGWHPRCWCYTTSKQLNRKGLVRYLKTGKVDPRQYTSSIPAPAKEYLLEHKSQIRKMKNKPYFIQDNFTGKGELRKDVLRTRTTEQVLNTRQSAAKTAA